MNFDFLVSTIEQTHRHFQQQAAKAINIQLTLRNWLIGFYIVEFEQAGEDRAKYGTRLLEHLALSLKIKGLVAAELSRCRQFYKCYPQILGTLSQELNKLLPKAIAKELPLQIGTFNQNVKRTPTPTETNGDLISSKQDSDTLLLKLSFSHFAELIKVENDVARAYYELECIQGTWSVRELRRQINSLYYERSRMSQNPDKLREAIALNSKTNAENDFIKSVYAFEFLDLNPKDVVEESDLEKALVDHLQEFMMELGHGFCLEARQKKILIGDTYFFIDLVFYHRILKCHVLVELKVDAFSHAHISQLNTYVNYYRKEVKTRLDKPPIGILLVTNKNHSLVEYATAGMNKRMFVSKYLLKLPSKELLEDFISSEIKDWKQV
ncbi:MAG: YhcG family protein [Bacteroidota bacterium]|jgi:predicted nuclease of restriction endonuclease-like (RecB) superfamily